VGEEVLGIMELANKGTWFDNECQAATQDKNKAFKKMQQGYGTRSLIEKDKRRKEKTIHRRKKKEWVNMELLRKQHECRKFYKEINTARKQVKPRVNISRNEEGSLISNEQETLKTWVRYFDKLLNRRKDNECVTLTTTSSNQISKGNTQYITDAPTTKGTETALKVLKNYEAPGTDNISAELLKFGDQRLKQWPRHIFSSIWIKEEIPKERLKGITCPLHKKGD
jgi:hypothetical protein